MKKKAIRKKTARKKKLLVKLPVQHILVDPTPSATTYQYTYPNQTPERVSPAKPRTVEEAFHAMVAAGELPRLYPSITPPPPSPRNNWRSEERRVGKECRP